MKSILRFLFLGTFLCSIQSSFAQNHRLVGYLPYYQFHRVDDIDFEKLTHVCLAFANPDADGNLSIGGRDIEPIVEVAHDANVDVLLSLAGGALSSDWWAAWQNLTTESNRSAFIHKIITYLYDHDLQGIDMDLEWQYVEDWYSGFSMELSDSLQAHDFLYTAAFPGTYRYPEISDEALRDFDFINTMVYDLTGPWNPNNAGPHSPYSFAENSIKYWRDKQGIAPENLTLGIPFYGWNFNDPTDVFSFTYRSMVNQNPANALRDNVDAAYYNGIMTVRQKTELAMAKVSGVMIWELGQDHFDKQFSLLNAIHQVISANVSSNEEIEAFTDINIYPNPFSDFFFFENPKEQDVQIILTDASGRLIAQQLIPAFSTETIGNTQMVKGLYFLRLIWEDGVGVSKVVVKE